ncbi:MAG: porin [Luteolibacter sp.]
MKLPRTNTLATTAALLVAAAQIAPAHTFRERFAEGGDVSAEDIDASFSSPQNQAWYDRFSFGSYGEAHFNTGDVADKFDVHRIVLFTGYEFNDRLRFVSEVELEHLYSNNPGTDLVWELEQAYFELDLGNDYLVQAGAFLVPVGITNEIHEPTTFYGVERNAIETEILPSTWTEFGFLLRKTYDNGLQWDFAIHRGLDVDPRNVNLNGPDLRNGRQKTEGFDDLGSAATARVRYTGINGLELAASLQYQDDISTGGDDNSAILTTAHFVYTNGGFGLRGLIANWHINGDTSVGGTTVAGQEIDNQFGGFIEPSYKWTLDNGMAVGVFGRAMHWRNEDAPDGQTNYQAGVNFWPCENVVLKADWEHQDRANGRTNRDNYNFGVGYAF